jgi:hypothetical protein
MLSSLVDCVMNEMITMPARGSSSKLNSVLIVDAYNTSNERLID